MKPPPEVYGDNFPVAEGWWWDPRVPWRHVHVMPTVSLGWWSRVGWWTVVVLLMGALLLVVARDGFSEEAGPPAAGVLLVTFQEGAVRYPEQSSKALLHQVRFLPASLQRLNARYGLVTIERVVNPAQSTAQMYRLVFASSMGLDRTLLAYRRDPHVVSASLVLPDPRPAARARSGPPLALYTRDA